MNKIIIFGVARSLIITIAIFGAFFIVLGVSQLFVACRDDDIDSKVKAMTRLAVGIWLLFVINFLG